MMTERCEYCGSADIELLYRSEEYGYLCNRCEAEVLYNRVRVDVPVIKQEDVFHYALTKLYVYDMRPGYQYVVRYVVRNGREELNEVNLCTCPIGKDHYNEAVRR